MTSAPSIGSRGILEKAHSRLEEDSSAQSPFQI